MLPFSQLLELVYMQYIYSMYTVHSIAVYSIVYRLCFPNIYKLHAQRRRFTLLAVFFYHFIQGKIDYYKILVIHNSGFSIKEL